MNETEALQGNILKELFKNQVVLIYNLFDEERDLHYYLGHSQFISSETLSSLIKEAYKNLPEQLEVDEEHVDYEDVVNYLCEHHGFLELSYENPVVCLNLKEI